jgi:sugar phosphate isomerase/epimerase
MATDSISAVTHSTAPTLPNLRLGTAPDSWGVWFPDDPQQVPWQQFLDEAAAAGYALVELGPFGYLPTHPEQLATNWAAVTSPLPGPPSAPTCTADLTPSARRWRRAGRSPRCLPR